MKWVVEVLVAALAIYYVLPDVVWHHAQAGAFSGNRRDFKVSLTFDDGPGPDTAAILDVLKEKGVHATFFVIADNLPAWPETVARMVAEGHELALHGLEHRSSYLMSPWGTYRRLARGKAAVEAASGSPLRWYRPPWGHHNLVTGWAARALGMTRVLWNIAPDDWREDHSPEWICRYVVQMTQPGGVVVLHDGGGDRHRTQAALGPMIDGLRALGLSPVPIGELQRDVSRLHKVWTWWELRFTRKWDIDTIPMSRGGAPILRLGRIHYRGPVRPMQPQDLRPGDVMAEIHFGNPALSRLSGDAKGTLRAVPKIIAALGDVAQYIQNDPKYRDAQALGGITLLDAAHAIEKLGFRRGQVLGWKKWTMWIYLTWLMAMYHQQGWATFRRFFRLHPVMVYISREDFLVRYGAEAMAAARARRKAAGKSVPVASNSSVPSA